MIVAYVTHGARIEDYEQLHIIYATPEGIVCEWCDNKRAEAFRLDYGRGGKYIYKNFAEVRAYLAHKNMDILHDDGEE